MIATLGLVRCRMELSQLRMAEQAETQFVERNRLFRLNCEDKHSKDSPTTERDRLEGVVWSGCIETGSGEKQIDSLCVQLGVK